MTTKYSKEYISDITKTFIQRNLDADFIRKKLFEDNGFSTPHHYECATIEEDSLHGKVDEHALANFGERLFNDQLHADINAYHLILPSVNTPEFNHAVALMVDKKNKEILYQDSYGIDMRKELHDFFKTLFPDYKIGYNTQIQQYKNKNDSSCSLLADYNLLDMWYRKSDQLDKMNEYDSYQAREAVWEIVKQIKPDIPPKENNNKPKFKIGKISIPVDPKNFKIQLKRNTHRNFKYQITKEKNYKELLDGAANIARLKHKMYKKRVLGNAALSR